MPDKLEWMELDWKEIAPIPDPPVYDVRLGIHLDKPTRTGRIYPREVWERAMEAAQAKIKQRTLLVHSDTPATLNNVVGIVEELGVLGDEVAFAGVSFLGTIKGQEWKKLIDAGFVNFFTCGIGSIKDGVVQPDFELEHICAELPAPRPRHLF